MPVLLLSRTIAERHSEALAALRDASPEDPLEVLQLPEEADSRLDEASLARIHAGYFSTDMTGADGASERALSRKFLGSIRRAPNVRWLHLGHAGTDDPIFQELMGRGVAVSNSSGVTAEPIALSVIGGLLALHRGFPRWYDAQRRRAWEQLPRIEAPPDLRGQTIVVVGLGAIGGHIARLSQALGLYVIGVRRREASAGDHVDRWVHPDQLKEVLPAANWLALTVPLTAATRHLIDRESLALLPTGAYVLNVARGAVVDEGAMIEELRSRRLGGAYLDVFETEPLPPESPIWDLPNVIVSPHDSSPSAGNSGRADALFLEELGRWLRGDPLQRLVQER